MAASMALTSRGRIPSAFWIRCKTPFQPVILRHFGDAYVSCQLIANFHAFE